VECNPSLKGDVKSFAIGLDIKGLTSRFSECNNFGMNNRWEMRHIQENAKPGKYVGCNELNVSLKGIIRKDIHISHMRTHLIAINNWK
jgi:hypothetical protein